ncbi:immunity 49 family protein [Pseudoalteromonas luteoviolacea]|uniref:immunity 49 family protein n=1 Tax=Pseudoalteromonas luteoviolacea TaxID=43657 RepID=UPI001B3A7606|nr:immunity 49 family protein [Pseudoalteromonas luteoviolacea]MBQ4880091.1 immunity 49 family protein [Pseudoalteromonas luteoviolacea]MBQ4909108.1 immunity 49 family protein [Pseudoalteromonas luteoviolacea]
MTHIKIYPRHYDDMDIYKKIFMMVSKEEKEDIKNHITKLSESGPYATIGALLEVVNSIALNNYQYFRFFYQQEQLETTISHWRLVCDLYKYRQIGVKLDTGLNKIVRIFDTEFHLFGIQKNEWPSTLTLCLMLEMAAIMRDQACIDTLITDITAEDLRIDDTSTSIPGLTAHANYIHSAICDNSEPVTLLEKCNALSKHISTDYCNDLSLWQALDELRTTQDLEAFEAAVVAQFTRHSNMHKHDTGLITHMLPKQLIAPVCIAHDKYGYVPQHQNDYLPEWLLTGKFEQAIPSCD